MRLIRCVVAVFVASCGNDIDLETTDMAEGKQSSGGGVVKGFDEAECAAADAAAAADDDELELE